MKSIRRRLLLLQLSAVVLIAGLGVGGAYYRVRDLFYEMQDYHLQQVALLLLQQGELTEKGAPVLLPGEEDLEVVGQVWSENHKLVYSSHRDYALPRSAHSGLQTVVWDEEPFRLYSIARAGWTVQVAQSLELREEALHSITLRLLAPLALIVPLLGVATWVTVGRGMRPLAALRDEVVQRNPASLMPIALEHAPEEVRPLVGSLNDLLARLGQAIDSQRRFTADAAHELRTPLTGVKLQFQLLERVQSESERQRAIDNLKDGIDRAIRLVQQLLTLARFDPGAEESSVFAPVALAPLVARTVEDFLPHARQKRIALSLARCDPVGVAGNEDQLRTLLGNLLDNAIRYTPVGGLVTVSLTRSDSEAIIEVSDNGPGIRPNERKRVFDRFYRVAGSAAPGSGLGLSIVQRVAEAHRGQVELHDSPMHGLLVEVRLPALSGA
jgi:two-component system OmpR family sensor kinase